MPINATFKVTDNTSTEVIKASVTGLDTSAVIHSKLGTTTSDVVNSIIPMSALTTFQFMSLDELTSNSKLESEVDKSGKIRWYVKGDGVLDKFMEVASNHLDAARLNNSIRNEDAGTVATTIFAAAMQNAVQYIMQRHAQWLAAQQQVKQNELADIQRRSGEAQIANIAAQTIGVNQQMNLVTEQIELTKSQKTLIDAQEATEKKKPELVEMQTQGFKVNSQIQGAKVIADHRAMYDSLTTTDGSILKDLEFLTEGSINKLYGELLNVVNYSKKDFTDTTVPIPKTTPTP